MKLYLFSAIFAASYAVSLASQCYWSSWGEWSECECPKGKMKRTRDCVQAYGRPCQYGDCSEYGKDFEEKDCCCVTWGPWGKWKCKKRCTAQRKRKCVWNYRFCKGKPKGCRPKKAKKESKKCPWGPWGACSVTCGVGVRARSCKCKDIPYLRPCGRETESCEVKPDCTWTEWAPVGECYETDGYPKKCVRDEKRYCKYPCPYYKDKVETRQVECRKEECCKCGDWSDWMDDGKCYYNQYQRCMQKQYRTCECQDYCRKDCNQREERTVPCADQNGCCDCTWTQWAADGDCYETDGYPKRCVRKEKRYCRYPGYCDDKPKEETREVECDREECCKCGDWSEWMDDGKCYYNQYQRCMQKQYRTCECQDYCPKDCNQKEERVKACEDQYGCCECTWTEWATIEKCKKRGNYPYGCQKKQARYCDYPSYCKDHEKDVEYRYDDCDKEECCPCTWTRWEQGDCMLTSSYPPKCVRTDKRYCRYEDTQYCGPPKVETRTALCDRYECCSCNWSAWGDCKYVGSYPRKCQKHRECECTPDYCPENCRGPAYEDCGEYAC